MTSLPLAEGAREIARVAWPDQNHLNTSFGLSRECAEQYFSAWHRSLSHGDHQHAIEVRQAVAQICDLKDALLATYRASKRLANIDGRKRLLKDGAEHLTPRGA